MSRRSPEREDIDQKSSSADQSDQFVTKMETDDLRNVKMDHFVIVGSSGDHSTVQMLDQSTHNDDKNVCNNERLIDNDQVTERSSRHCYVLCRTSLHRLCLRYSSCLWTCFLVLIGILYFVYFYFAMRLHGGEPRAMSLIAITVVLVVWILCKLIGFNRMVTSGQRLLKRHRASARWIKRFLALLCIGTTIATLVTEVILKRPSNLTSLSGVALITGSAYLTSTHPDKVSWRPVISGLILQYLFALAIIRVSVVRDGFAWVAAVIDTIIGFSSEGSIFLFGSEYKFTGFIFFLIPTIILAMALLTILEHSGVLHLLMRIVGRFLALCLGCSAAESLNAAANIFLGPIDSLMVISPFLEYLTPSQLHCLMTNGMATVTGSIMGVYIMLGVSPQHLLSASVMSAPAALSLAKLAVPETRPGANTMLFEDAVVASRFQNVMDAASSGAMTALKLAASIMANVTFVVSGMKMVNATLSWFGGLVNIPQLSLQFICSYVFYPLAVSMGVEPQDGRKVASLIGVKTFINEIVAYTTLGIYGSNRQELDRYVQSNYTDWYYTMEGDTNIHESIVLPAWNKTLAGGIVSERSEVIATYALCGFANFICVGVLLGCYCVMIPSKKDIIYSFVFRAMVVGNCASFLTACVAGLFY